MTLGLFLNLLAVRTTWLLSQHLHVSGDPVVVVTFSKPRCDAAWGRKQQAELSLQHGCALLHPYLSPRFQLGFIESPSPLDSQMGTPSYQPGPSSLPQTPPPLYSPNFNFLSPSLSVAKLDIHFLITDDENYRRLGVPEVRSPVCPTEGEPVPHAD